MIQHSGRILLYKYIDNQLQVLLVHPGGPFWAKKDPGSWSIPKGLFESDESPLEAAKREFLEETGFEIDGSFQELGEIKQPSGKIIHAWAICKDLDAAKIKSNVFSMEWPKGSGKIKEFPEINKGQWFSIEEAKKKILPGQLGFIDRLLEKLNKP